MTVATICLVLLALAAMPFWGPIVLISVVLVGSTLLALLCWPFDAIDRWKRRRARGRRR